MPSWRTRMLGQVATGPYAAETVVFWRRMLGLRILVGGALVVALFLDQSRSAQLVVEMLPFGLLATMANLSLVGAVLGRKTALVLGATTAALLGAAVARNGHTAPAGLYVFGITAVFAVVTSTLGYGRVHQRLNARYETIVDQLGLVVWGGDRRHALARQRHDHGDARSPDLVVRRTPLDRLRPSRRPRGDP